MKTNCFFRFVVIIGVLIYCPDLFAQGCSQCKMIPQSDLDGGGTSARAINPAILYLMAFPYIILLLLFRKQIISFYKSFRK